jgi:3',5'-cyclic-AMP phosphodiesterase
MTATNPQFTVGIVTDIHYGPNVLTKRGQDALSLLEATLADFSRREVDLVIDLGDRISDISPSADLDHFEAVATRFDLVSVERRHLLGNHDVVHLDRGLQARRLASPLEHHSIKRAGWHFSFLFSQDGSVGGCLTQADLDWLRRDLAAAEGPAIVFTHQPIGAGSMAGNRYFGTHFEAESAEPGGAAVARRIMATSGRVTAVVSGHVHWTRQTEFDGVSQICLQSLSELDDEGNGPTGASALLRLGTEAEIEVLGREPAQFVFTLPTGWTE